MSPDNIAQLLYLGALGLVLGGAFLLTNKLRLSQTLQMAAIWALIFIGAIAVVGLWGDVRNDLFAQQTRVQDDGTIAVPRARDGHYYLTLEINGKAVDFMVDTGATDIVLNQADAAAAGLNQDELNYFGRAATANGEVRTAPVRLDTVAIGPFEDTNVPAVVNDGALDQSLLGMGYLEHWGRIEISQGELKLSR